MEVADPVAADPDESRADVEDLVGFDGVLLECRRRGHDLEGRAGLVHVLHGAIAALRRRCGTERVGVERRRAGERQHLAGLRVEHHNRTRIRVVGANPRPELALDDVLEMLVDGQLDGRAGRWRPVDAAERAAPGIGVDQDLSRLAADLRVVGRLDPAQALVVDADVADEVGRELAVGIVAPVLGEESDTGQPQRRHAPRLLGRRLALHVCEIPAAPETILQSVPTGRGAVDQGVADCARGRCQLVVVDSCRACMDGTGVRVDFDAGQPQSRHAPRIRGRRVGLQQDGGPAPPEATFEGGAVRWRAVVQGVAERAGGGCRIIDIGRYGVDRVGVDAVREHAPIPIQDLSALRMHLDGPPLLSARSRDQLRVLHDLQVHQPGLDGGDPDREHADRHQDPALQRVAPRHAGRLHGSTPAPDAPPDPRRPSRVREPAHPTPPAVLPRLTIPAPFPP